MACRRSSRPLLYLRRRARPQWQGPVINQWEVDGYDALDSLYVLSLDDSMRVIGGVRLLPTTGLNMLNDTFPELLPDGVRIESPLIWEASRFMVRMTGLVRNLMPHRRHTRTLRRMLKALVTSKLLVTTFTMTRTQ